MTRTTNARIAGFAYLFYIAVAFPAAVLMQKATIGAGTAAKLANIAQHASDVRLAIILSLLGTFAALVLAGTLYGITRDEDHELALLGMSFRVAEGVLGAIGTVLVVSLLRLATTPETAAGAASDAPTSAAIAQFLLNVQLDVASATFFAVGSTIFCYLLLRGRIVPVALASLGVFASALLVVLLPLQLAGVLRQKMLVWMPMLLFELTLALWLIIKGAAEPARRQPA